MTESQKRIAEYKERLPHLKEKIVAVALLFAMSIAMMTTASFAWLTLSKRPEIAGVKTSIAANGNLEIALADKDGLAPDTSTATDGALALALRNITWGNLVNLSDAQYGLENLDLRPARLNMADLLNHPLSGAVFSDDGRVEALSGQFGYTVWDSTSQQFKAPEEGESIYGVRAISSLQLKETSDTAIYTNQLEEVKKKNAYVGTQYLALAENDAYITTLTNLISAYITSNINNDSDEKLDGNDIKTLLAMYNELLGLFDYQADAFVALLNVQRAVLQKSDSEKYGNIPEFTRELLYASTVTDLKNYGFSFNTETKSGVKLGGLNDLAQFLKDRTTIEEDIVTLEGFVTRVEAGETIRWVTDDMTNFINKIVPISGVIIRTEKGEEFTIGALGSNLGTALQATSGNNQAIITSGILKRFEQRCGAYMQKSGMSVKVTVVTVRATVSTNADRTYYQFNNDVTATTTMIQNTFAGKLEYTSQDTYGLAVDLWVRTNAPGENYLTLEGNVLLGDEYTVELKGKNAEGEEVQLYTITLKGGEMAGVELTETKDVYQDTDENGDTIWRYATTHSLVESDILAEQTPVKKVEVLRDVIGYEGENRVWPENALLDPSSTTQGGGSCYIYYADNPIDQARSLELMKAMKVAFVDATGTLLATAHMDTEHYYATTSKVVVPLVLDEDSLNIGETTDDNGEVVTQYAITQLEQNQAMRITVIVYLDGDNLENDDVLSQADIQGQLNIQFGNSLSLEAISNEKLESETLSVSAEISGDTNTAFDSDDKPTASVAVTVHSDTYTPTTVTGFFIRKINDYQGSRQETMTFTKQEDGTWTADYTFEYPGVYILRSVQLDGVDYELTNDPFPTATITGFEISNVTYGMDKNVMTADETYSGPVQLKFMSSDPADMPKKVQGVFLREEDGMAVNVNFTSTTEGIWTGNATFAASGAYTMEYVILDGKYYVYLSDEDQFTVDITLGVRAKVSTTAALTMTYSQELDALPMRVELFDDTGKELVGLAGVSLYYYNTGSTLAQNGMYTTLSWNDTTGYYEGEFQPKAGIFRFNRVEYKSNSITKTSEASPVFNIIPPDPPTYVDNSITAVENQYVPNATGTITIDESTSSATYNGATITLTLKNAPTAITRLCLQRTKDGKTETVWTEGYSVVDETNNIAMVTFVLPQEGTWTVADLRVWNVYDADGNYYPDPTGDNIDYSASGYSFDNFNTGTTVTALYHVEVKFENMTTSTTPVIEKTTDAYSIYFGVTGTTTNPTATFMTSHKLTGLSVTFTDSEGTAIDPNKFAITAQLGFFYSDIATTYGGYSHSNAKQSILGSWHTLVQGTGSTFTLGSSDSVEFLVAAGYSPVLTYSITDDTATTAAKFAYSGYNKAEDEKNVLTFTSDNSAGVPYVYVYSVKPTVTISAISPTGSIPTEITYTLSTKWHGKIPTFTATGYQTPSINDAKTVAYVYAQATVDNSSQHHGSFTRPTLTLTVAGVDSLSTVSVTLPAGNAKNSAIDFSRTGNGTITKTLGSVSQINSWTSGLGLYTHTLSAYYGHGDQTITTMTIVRDGQTYTVVLGDNSITIHNPSSVNQ